MNNQNVLIGLTVISYIILAVIIGMIPSRIKKLKSETGKLLMSLKSELPFRSIAVFVVCAALIGIVPFRNFALYLAVIFDATALLASWMSSKEAANAGMNGVFENMIISDTTAIKYDDILSLPTVAYEKDEDTTQVDFRVIEVLPEHGARIQLIFPDEAVRNQALEIILKQCPRLGE